MSRLLKSSLQKSFVFTALISCLTLVACNGKTEMSTGQDKADQEGTKKGGIADTIRSQKDHNDVLTDIDPLPEKLADLMSFLAQKQAEQLRPADQAAAFRIQKQRAAASAKLLEMKINGEQRFEFIRIRIDALLKLIASGDPKAKADLQKLVAEYGQHGQSRIRQAVTIGGLIFDFREAIAASGKPEDQSTISTTPELTKVIDTAANVVSEYPASFDVCKEIGAISDQLLKLGHRQAWNELSQVLINGYKESENETCRLYTQRLSGRIQVASANLDLIVEQIRKREPGAIESYRKAVTYLFSDSNINLASLEPIVGSLKWLEKTGMHDATLEANRIVMAASLNIANSKVRDQLRSHCEKRDARLGLVGKPFSISALTDDGNRLDWTALSKESPVIVVFWSPKEPASVKLVQQMANYYETHKHQGLKLLAVSVANESNNVNLTGLFGDEPVEWVIAKGNPSVSEGPSEFIWQFGISNVPQLVLVNDTGIVTAVNPTATETESLLGELVR